MANKSVLTGKRGPDGLYEIKLKDKCVHYPSVTTVLSLLEDKEVASIKENLEPEVWDYVSRRGADRGSVMHTYLENYAIALKKNIDSDNALLYTQKKTPTQFPKIEPKFFNLGRDFFYNIYHSPFIDEMIKPVLIEGLVVSPEHKYAGRVDIIYKDHNNKLVIGDYKTSTKPIENYQRKLIKYKIQTAAYANAFYELYKVKPDYGVIWVAHPEGYQKFTVHENEMDVYLNCFLYLVTKYYNEYIK